MVEPVVKRGLLHPGREWSLTALVVLEVLALFVVAPLAAKRTVPFSAELPLAVAIVVVVIAVVWPSRLAVAAVILSAVLELLATVLRITHSNGSTQALDFAAAMILLISVTIVLGVAVFGPGRVTIHRILGAVAIYLNTAAAFAFAYRVVEALNPAAFTLLGPASNHHPIPTLIYFSFSTLTTSGYGDIVPIDSYARSLSNLEAVIGQLYPATLLARLITLEVAGRQQGPQ
ncbi:MAG TPA: ion channel [Candidatus Elarobacter sp.]|nr:ion channel [Candidatus Elarobacter sp.]